MKQLSAARRGVRQRGFTLLELLLSMTLTALLLGILSAGIYGVVNDWQDESAGLETELDQALALLQLERALQGAFPHTYVNRERLSRFIYFNGEAERLRFVSTASPQRQTGLTAWELYQDAERGVLLRLAPAFSDDPTARLEAARPVSLLPGYRLRLHYLVQRGFDEKEWLDAWDAAELQSLPLAVWIEFLPQDRRDERAETLELLAPIRAWRHTDIEPNLPVR
jgi:general secretion pathway protein J